MEPLTRQLPSGEKATLKTKSEFLSVVSHELRTPLTSIKGALNLINSGVLGEIPKQLQQVLDVANRNSIRLAALVDDLLDMQSLESGSMLLEFEPVDISSSSCIKFSIETANSI